jgi:hypothetical protein
MPRNRYKDTPVLVKDVAAKVRQLIDDHVISLGVDPKIPPIALTDVDFDTHLSRQPNDRAKASEMEHAIRSHIRKHLDEDPVLFRKRSERLNEILKTLADQYDDLIAALHKIVIDLQTGSAGMDAVPPDRFLGAVQAASARRLGRVHFQGLVRVAVGSARRSVCAQRLPAGAGQSQPRQAVEGMTGALNRRCQAAYQRIGRGGVAMTGADRGRSFLQAQTEQPTQNAADHGGPGR